MGGSDVIVSAVDIVAMLEVYYVAAA